MEKSGITFIFSNIDFNDNDLPFSISASMQLRAATDIEVERFTAHLLHVYGFRGQIVPVHHLCVITFNGTITDLINLSNVANLITPKLRFGSTFIYGGTYQQGEPPGAILEQHTKMDVFVDELTKPITPLKSEELHKLRKYYEAIYLAKTDSSHTRYALELYKSTSSLRLDSSLSTLSLFSIIESLIAHKPKLTETLDSITHQIKHKINLLSKRFETNVDHEELFGEIGIIKLWGKLYGLRSDIAHGQTYEFKGTYDCLKSLYNINQYLDEVVKELLKLYINEENLIADIREC